LIILNLLNLFKPVNPQSDVMKVLTDLDGYDVDVDGGDKNLDSLTSVQVILFCFISPLFSGRKVEWLSVLQQVPYAPMAKAKQLLVNGALY
jgi:hypothetical protein